MSDVLAARRCLARLLATTTLAGLFCIGASTAGAALYDESSSGDLSSLYTAPSFLQLDTANAGPSPGTFGNVITGTIGRFGSPSVLDRDYLTINVPVGFQLRELRVGNQSTFPASGLGSFIAIGAGTTMPNPDTATDGTGLLGYRIYGPADRNSDILDDLSIPFNGTSGFSRPLGAGDYTLWIQERSTGSYVYRFNAIIAPVPEPSALGTTLLGGLLLVGLALSRRTQSPH
jgi:hypothetical protein